jgi:hypothetical protein
MLIKSGRSWAAWRMFRGARQCAGARFAPPQGCGHGEVCGVVRPPGRALSERAHGGIEMLRMGVDRLGQKVASGADLTLPDRGQCGGVQKLRTLDLGHAHEGQLVVALRRACENEVVLCGEEVRIVGDRLQEQFLRAVMIAARQPRETPVVQDTRRPRRQANGGLVEAFGGPIRGCCRRPSPPAGSVRSFRAWGGSVELRLGRIPVAGADQRVGVFHAILAGRARVGHDIGPKRQRLGGAACAHEA